MRALLVCCLDNVFKVVVEILEDDVLDEFTLLVLTVEEILYLYDVRAAFEDVEHLVLAAHAFTDLFDAFESDSLPCFAIDCFEDIA